MKKVFFIFLSITSIAFCKGQSMLPPGTYSSTNKKAIASFESALKYFDQRNDVKANEELKKAIEAKRKQRLKEIEDAKKAKEQIKQE